MQFSNTTDLVVGEADLVDCKYNCLFLLCCSEGYIYTDVSTITFPQILLRTLTHIIIDKWPHLGIQSINYPRPSNANSCFLFQSWSKLTVIGKDLTNISFSDTSNRGSGCHYRRGIISM